MTGDVVARAKDVLAYGLPISTDLALALVHEVQRLRAETEGGRTAMTTDPALVERVSEILDQLDQAIAALERVRALCEPVLTEYVDDGEPVLAQAILDVIRGSR